MTVAIGDVARVTAEGEGLSGQDMQNVFYIRNNGIAVSEADAIADLVEILEALYTLMAAAVNVGLVIRRIRAVNDTQGTDIGVGTFTDDTPGTGVGGALPPQCSYGVSLTTSALSSVGRKFFPLPDEGAVNANGTLLALALDNLADMGDHMTEEQVATNTDWLYGLKQTTGGAFLEFLNFTVTSNVVTQRRRRAGIGS